MIFNAILNALIYNYKPEVYNIHFGFYFIFTFQQQLEYEYFRFI